MQRDSIANTFRVAILLCLVCSVAVSVFAVGLRPTQQKKKEEFRQQNILTAAGLWTDETADKGEDATALFKKLITPVVIDLTNDRLTDEWQPGAPEIETEAALRDPNLSQLINGGEDTGTDIAGIRRRQTFETIYEVRDGDKLKTLVLPIRGYGLWSTLWGFIAIDFSEATGDPQSLKVEGLTYYKHAETPGLGGEVDNPAWKARWEDKKIFDSDWSVRLEVAKNATGEYEVDALSGATLTSNGVSNMLAYWLGDSGYGPYLKTLLNQNTTSNSEAK
jgi:Na+-transporting NADH:ubiquinone oxidoreductase subunit C